MLQLSLVHKRWGTTEARQWDFQTLAPVGQAKNGREVRFWADSAKCAREAQVRPIKVGVQNQVHTGLQFGPTALNGKRHLLRYLEN